MKKLAILLFAITAAGCSNTKIINGKEQTFTEFVLLNKFADKNANMTWEEQSSDCFPGLRLIKWNQAEEVKRNEN